MPPQTTAIPPLAVVPKTFGQRVMRLVHFCQSRFGNRFGDEVKFLAQHIPADAVSFDVGGNLGRFARSLALWQRGAGKIFCFEPLPYNYSLAQPALRGFKTVKVFLFALSTEAGAGSFFVPVKKASKRLGIAYGHLGRAGCEAHFAATPKRDVYQVAVQIETLDRMAAAEKVTRLDFVKVDVEGAEGLVFRGGLATLARFKPVIYCEIGPGFPERVGLTTAESIAPLLALGYQMFVVRANATLERCHECLPTLENYLFLHAENPRTILPPI
jgi:FkbM family methyltransferase